MLYTLAIIFLIACLLCIAGMFIGMIYDSFEVVVGPCIIGFVLFAILACAFGLSGDASRHNYLMEQCMADGKKEYECVALLQKPASQVIPMPIIIPMR